mmetsp:Transcript_9358/g.25234  ORF Transcript_9358/g.25234 Transcript_9358/m.25234 type:complete len:97 (+) Transcript_9358:929-1219(+)
MREQQQQQEQQRGQQELRRSGFGGTLICLFVRLFEVRVLNDDACQSPTLVYGAGLKAGLLMLGEHCKHTQGHTCSADARSANTKSSMRISTFACSS